LTWIEKLLVSKQKKQTRVERKGGKEKGLDPQQSKREIHLC
jgi:hypothetical protein